MNDQLSQRIYSIDLLRGLVILIMALDHIRDFFSPTVFMPEDLAQSDAAFFVTRWVTHFCAPVFVFLAGTSAYLHGRRLVQRGPLASFLLVRGAWLIVLELLVVNPSFMGSYAMAFGQVIWALGWSMIVLAALIWLPRWIIALFAIVMIAGHNALDGIAPTDFGPLAWLWQILHVQGWIPFTDDPRGYGFWVAYPLVPWLGVMALGYVVGPWFESPASYRRRLLWIAGLVMIAAFMALRISNVYGDASLWQPQARGELYTVLSFLNTTKYPPSLLYLLMTLGPALLLLALWDRAQPSKNNPLLVFGQVPLFFYLLHVPLIHLCGFLFMRATYGAAINMMNSQAWPDAYTPKLWVTYAAWIGLTFVLYWVCLWYRDIKMRHRDSLLRFL